MFEYLNNVTMIILEVICLRIFFDTLIQHSDNKNRKSEAILNCFVHIIVFLIIVALFKNNLIIKEVLVITSSTLIMKLYKRISYVESLKITFIVIALMFAMDALSYLAIESVFEEFDKENQGNVFTGRMIVLVGKMMVFTIFVSIRIWKERKNRHSRNNWIRFTCSPIGTIAALITLTVGFKNLNNRLQENIIYMISFGMVVLNLYIYELINEIKETELRIKRKELEYAQFKNQIDIYNTLKSGLERQRKAAHEFRNHISYINSLIRERDYTALEEYIDKIGDNSGVPLKVIDTKNAVVNTIVNEKYQEMENKNIVFVMKSNDLSELTMESDDLVVLLSNILNNAIEACEKCEEGHRIVKLKFTVEEGRILISSRNTYKVPVELVNSEFRTVKYAEKENHGFGIKNIQDTVKKYEGVCRISYTDTEFKLSVMIPIA